MPTIVVEHELLYGPADGHKVEIPPTQDTFWVEAYGLVVPYRHDPDRPHEPKLYADLDGAHIDTRIQAGVTLAALRDFLASY